MGMLSSPDKSHTVIVVAQTSTTVEVFRAVRGYGGLWKFIGKRAPRRRSTSTQILSAYAPRDGRGKHWSHARNPDVIVTVDGAIPKQSSY